LAGLYLTNKLKREADERPLVRRALWRLEAGLLAAIWGVSRLLGPDRASALACRLMRVAGPRLRHHPKLRRNLKAAFPDWTPEQIERTARAAWGQVGRVIAEFPHLERICAKESDRIEVVSHCDLEPMRSGARPAVFVAAHQANWELAGATGRLTGVPLAVIYSPQRNTVLHGMMQRCREALHCRFVPKKSSAHALLSEIKAGRSIGVLMDQRYDDGDSVPFFGRSAPVALAPAMIAARMGLPLVPVRIERLEGCHFRVTVQAPIEPDRSLGSAREIARDMTSRVYVHFEQWIRERPEQWLCIKHRWPNLRKPKWQAKLAKNPRLAGGREPAAAPRPAELDGVQPSA
jgi:KDO2-lipid IV(A) lauroyltransferase